LPSAIPAGSFLSRVSKNFWDVSNKANAIVIDLKEEENNRLIIEVENLVDAIVVLSRR
jgi:hypothetical protein